MKRGKQKVIYILSFLTAVVLLDYFFKNHVNYVSSYFLLNSPSWCPFISHFRFFEFDGKYLIFALIYNLSTINAALLFIFFDSISLYINGILKLFYLDPRPFWENDRLYPCICAINYGNPSTSSINQFLVVSLCYRLLTKEYKFNKLMCGLLCAIPISCVAFSRFQQNAHSFSQLIFGIAVGYAIYYTTFEIFKVKFIGHRRLSLIMDNVFPISWVMILLYIVAAFTHYLQDLPYNQEWFSILLKHCEYTSLYYFDNESYVKTSRIFLLMGSIIGIYLDYRFRFNSNFNSYYIYNVKDSSKFNFTFNNTTYTKHALRVAFMLVFYYLVIKNIDEYPLDIKNDPYPKTLLLKYIIPFFLEGICDFFVLKVLFSLFNLSNDKIFLISTNNLDLSVDSLLSASMSRSQEKTLLNDLDYEVGKNK
jgi:membrane-associated phospholipid phosphatase